MVSNLVRYFELNFGWFFVNGQKQEAWCKYIQQKYGT